MDNKNDIYCFKVHIHLVRHLIFHVVENRLQTWLLINQLPHPISQQNWHSEEAKSKTHRCILCHIFTNSISKQYSNFSYKVNKQVSKTDWMPPQQIQTIQVYSFLLCTWDDENVKIWQYIYKLQQIFFKISDESTWSDPAEDKLSTQ